MLALLAVLFMGMSNPSVLSIPLELMVIPPDPYLTVPELQAIATSSAAKYGLTKKQTARMLKVVECESGWVATSTGKLGERGLAQIYQKYHPTITEKQMLDPYFSLDFLAKNLFKYPSWWSCHGILYP
ncbi:MAG: hypothetical protein AAB922_07745 [Patescibacteria group bacterium]